MVAAAATDTPRTARWLRGRLSTLSVPVYREQAPEGSAFPCIIFRRQGGVDIKTMRDTAMVRSVWLVFVAGRGSFQAESQRDLNALEALADDMHEAVNRPDITSVSGRLIHEFTRESEYEASVIENGTEYLQLGGIYRAYTTLA